MTKSTTRKYAGLNVEHADYNQFQLLLAQKRADGYQGRVAELFTEILSQYLTANKK
jgi:hypothetical protein